MGFVDLHTHSDASDGSFTPAHLVHLAKEAGLCAIALTDHDTTAGIADAVDAGKELGVEVIPGIEESHLQMKSCSVPIPRPLSQEPMWPVPWFRGGSVLLRIRPLKNIWNTVAATARPRRRPSRNPL